MNGIYKSRISALAKRFPELRGFTKIACVEVECGKLHTNLYFCSRDCRRKDGLTFGKKRRLNL